MAMIKKFIKVEARVNTYLAEHKGVSYKEACLAVLDSSDDGIDLIEKFPDYKSKKKRKIKRRLIMAIKKFIIKIYQVIADFILYRSYSKFRW